MTEWSWQQQVKSDKIAVRYSHSTSVNKCKINNNNNNAQCLLIFGGYNYNKGKPTWLKDSWLINLETMEVNEIKSKETPSARYSASLITTKNSVSILFGGNDGGLRYQSNQEMKNKGIGGSYIFGSYMNDLWFLENFEWIQKKNANHNFVPAPRSGHTASYIVEGNSMLIFGGLIAPFGINNKTFVNNDLYKYDIDGNFWTKIIVRGGQNDLVNNNNDINTHMMPQPRYGHSSVISKHNMYIFGGTYKLNTLKCKLRFSCSQSLNDLWLYDINMKNWKQIKSSFVSPGRLSHSSLVLHNSNKKLGLILYGGANCKPACKCFGDVWRYDIIKNSWNKITVIKKKKKEIPIHRYRHTMSYISTLNTYVLFGGESYGPSLYFNDIWTLTEIDSKTGMKVVNKNDLHVHIDKSIQYFQVIAFVFGILVIISAFRKGSYLRLRFCNNSRKRRMPQRFFD